MSHFSSCFSRICSYVLAYYVQNTVALIELPILAQRGERVSPQKI